MINVMFIVRLYNFAYTADDIGRLVILRCIRSLGVYVGNVY